MHFIANHDTKCISKHNTDTDSFGDGNIIFHIYELADLITFSISDAYFDQNAVVYFIAGSVCDCHSYPYGDIFTVTYTITNAYNFNDANVFVKRVSVIELYAEFVTVSNAHINCYPIAVIIGVPNQFTFAIYDSKPDIITFSICFSQPNENAI